LASFIEAQIPESLFFPIYNLPKDKWKDHQRELHNFFVGNPSPNCQPHPSTPSPCPRPVSAGPTAAAPPINIPVQLNPIQAFDPIAFMQQINTMMALHSQQPQTIVVES
jgi:hypothetical protein